MLCPSRPEATLTKAVGSVLCADCAMHQDVWVLLVIAVLYCSPDVLNEQEEEGLVSGGLLAVCRSIQYSVSPAHTRQSEKEIGPLGWKVTSSPTSNKPPLDDWYLGRSSSAYTPTQQSLPRTLSDEGCWCSAGLTWLTGSGKLQDRLNIKIQG